MRNGRAMLLRIFCILFILSAMLNEQVQSDSHIVKVTKEIDIGKLNETVEDLNTTVGTLNTTVGTLNTTVGKLETTVTKLEERTGIMLNLQYIILAGILGSPLVTIIIYRRFSKEKESTDTVDPTLQLLRELVMKLDVPPLEEVPNRRSLTRFPSGDELTNDLKSDDYATMEKI